MKTKALWISLTACLATAYLPASAQQDLDSVQITSQPVAPGLFMLTGSGGNIGVLTGEEGVVIVDDQFAELTEKIQATIATLSDEPVRMVLNTHWHSDHTGGNENFGEAGALIIAHENVRRRMNAEGVITFFNMQTPPSPPAALPVVTFTADVTLHLNGVAVRAEHLPGAHTDGDAIIWFDGLNAVHMGDTYFNGLYPFVDKSSGGSVAGMLAAADHVITRIDDETQIIPGHGPLSNKAELVAYRSMLATVAGRIEALVAEGKSTPEIIAAKPSAEYDAQWGQAFIQPDQWIGLLCSLLDCP